VAHAAATRLDREFEYAVECLDRELIDVTAEGRDVVPRLRVMGLGCRSSTAGLLDDRAARHADALPSGVFFHS
jgi:hypothetical protein